MLLLFNMIHYIDELEKKDLKGKRVLLRLDLNAPVLGGEIIDTHRLESVIPTIDFLRQNEAKIIIISHCAGKESETLVPMWHYLNGYFPVEFCSSYFTREAVDKLLKIEDKGILLFENIRMNQGEEANDLEFAKKLAQMADIYVNDAFSESHRPYASIVGVSDFLPHFAGLLFRQEVEHLSKIFQPEHPFVFILGGAKFETKLPLIKKYLEKADRVFVGGALSNDIYKTKGYETGASLVSKTVFDTTSIINNPKLVLPIDVTVEKDGTVTSKNPEDIAVDECIVDAGPETLEQIKNLLSNAKTIVWNGPLGNYEKGFGDKTEKLAEIVALSTASGAMSIIGGGDTLSAISKLGINHKFSFVSTGGGAMIDFLINETLPGVEALEK